MQQIVLSGGGVSLRPAVKSPISRGMLYPQRSTHLVQMPEDFPVGLKKTGLVIRDTAFFTEDFNDLLCFSQFVSGDSWKQVVLDLIIQPAVPKIRHRMRPNVARTQYLLVQEVQLGIFI